jgi:hypothetical protein
MRPKNSAKRVCLPQVDTKMSRGSHSQPRLYKWRYHKRHHIRLCRQRLTQSKSCTSCMSMRTATKPSDFVIVNGLAHIVVHRYATQPGRSPLDILANAVNVVTRRKMNRGILYSTNPRLCNAGSFTTWREDCWASSRSRTDSSKCTRFTPSKGVRTRLRSQLMSVSLQRKSCQRLD